LAAVHTNDPAQWEACDPSESVRSQDIIPALRENFVDVDIRCQGGAIVQFVLHDIAANFYDDSEETRAWLDMLIGIDCGQEPES
jgi:hypothetical protein